MSTDGASRVSVDSMAQTAQARKALWLDDLRSVRIVRFGLGVALAMAIAFGFNWPLQFLLPVLTASLLGSKQPAPTLREGFNNILSIAAAFRPGADVQSVRARFIRWCTFPPSVWCCSYLLPGQPRRSGLFRYHVADCGCFYCRCWAQQADLLADGIATAFIGFGALAVGVQWLAHAILPDPLETRPSAKRRGGFQSGIRGRGSPQRHEKHARRVAGGNTVCRRTLDVPGTGYNFHRHLFRGSGAPRQQAGHTLQVPSPTCSGAAPLWSSTGCWWRFQSITFSLRSR